MKERKIPRKNYIIYGIIVAVTLVLVFYSNEWYKVYKQNELENSYIANYIKEVNYLEFQNYVLENPNLIVYIGEKNSEKCVNFEKKLYKVIKENNLEDEIIFLNVSNVTDLNQILRDYKLTTLNSNLNIPSIAILNNSKFSDILNSDDKNEIRTDEIAQLLVEYEYIK
ncbi:MAG: hypothetical protein IJO32_07530 [Bacilli bacterium]|nr:hypothetical protein [Bacilli bacterium]